jgi:hypothetical protein
MNNSKAINTVIDMTMFDIVDLAPALKFTAVRENEPAKTFVRHSITNIFCFFLRRS